MKLVRHPCVVRLHEVYYSEVMEFWSKSILCVSHAIHQNIQVIASRTKIYIILEFITGGELFDKIVSALMTMAYA